MDHDAILSRLCGLGAPSGFEGPASRAAAELPGCAQELGELARCLDQLYFGGGAPAFSPARASELRRALRLASRPPERPARH